MPKARLGPLLPLRRARSQVSSTAPCHRTRRTSPWPCPDAPWSDAPCATAPRCSKTRVLTDAAPSARGV
eukprot:2863157-Prymnesium_polylepis.1